MDLFRRRRIPADAGDLPGRLAALEQYVDYLRQQGEYGMDQAEKRLTALEQGQR